MLGLPFPAKTKLALTLMKHKRTGDFYAVVAEHLKRPRSTVHCWLGPKRKSRVCVKASLEPVRCGAVLIDIGGRFDCMPEGVVVL